MSAAAKGGVWANWGPDGAAHSFMCTLTLSSSVQQTAKQPLEQPVNVNLVLGHSGASSRCCGAGVARLGQGHSAGCRGSVAQRDTADVVEGQALRAATEALRPPELLRPSCSISSLSSSTSSATLSLHSDAALRRSDVHRPLRRLMSVRCVIFASGAVRVRPSEDAAANICPPAGGTVAMPSSGSSHEHQYVPG